MAFEFLLIDGYNLLHAAGFARDQYGPGEYEACRQRLLRGLSERLILKQRERTTVVFDAVHAPPGAVSRLRFAGIDVMFAVGEDADTRIESLIAGHSAPKQVCVVSSDHRLQKAARRRGCRYVDSDEFWEARQAAGEVESLSPPEEKKFGVTGLSPGEVEAWSREFGIDSSSEGLAEPVGEEPLLGEVDTTWEELLERGHEALREAGELPEPPA